MFRVTWILSVWYDYTCFHTSAHNAWTVVMMVLVVVPGLQWRWCLQLRFCSVDGGVDNVYQW